jgi:hypothetical protein
MAFSASLSGAGLTAAQHAMALLSFNLGIELMQLALLALVLPALCTIVRQQPAWYSGVRAALASAAMVLAGLWVVQRLGLTVLTAGVERAIDLGFAGVPVVLWLLAGVAWYRRRGTPSMCAG